MSRSTSPAGALRRRATGLCIGVVLVAALCQWSSAWPLSNHLRTNHLRTNHLRPGPEEEEEPGYGQSSPFRFLAAKALGTLIRIASILHQWMPGRAQSEGPVGRPAKSISASYSWSAAPRLSYRGYDPYDID